MVSIIHALMHDAYTPESGLATSRAKGMLNCTPCRRLSTQEVAANEGLKDFDMHERVNSVMHCSDSIVCDALPLFHAIITVLQLTHDWS